ncbi:MULTISPECIES: O-succinylhomoserine sulfhydrylase [Cycloclasticus]|jgi:O-succinylhomoserine sulfhydrylase|uniref:O-succinylhomoserine sulfhydrylase n=1 Tax=Cycloclasticus zancles 78-ME TaxID=1198232 RepID=S5T8A2_9GAMM|nr:MULTISPECIES: O-succinylhomoserine sulfhydrylase [Cycloclasticus]AGS39834.1 O-succinylhomoserine sulfhydrylase [Cycloclasticus zancles 78-ME]MDF1828940.1 O-succinylhomoserine sulfhydrylase [Cycloclasticus pugetii]
MSDIDWQDYSIETQGVRAGQNRTPENEHSDAIFPTSSYVFGSAQEAFERFSGKAAGNIYSRFTNPTVRAFENRLAVMEGAERAMATSSGMAAINVVCLGLLSAGDHVICSRSVFGNTALMFKNIMQKFAVETTFVDLDDINAWASAIKPNTRFLFLETPSNPLGNVADIKALAELAHANGALLIVDNVYCTPALQKPLSLGADLVVHSATKYIDGQGRCIGGAVVGNNALIEEKIYPILRTAGHTMSPFNAWVFHKGLETLSLRMEKHCSNALIVARWLEQQSNVEKVYYTGLANHPQHELAKQQQSGFGGIVSFEVKGGKNNAWKVIDMTQMISITANLGDVKSMITHPSTTTHGRLTEDERNKAGITDALIRLGVGLENAGDITADLHRGLSSF